jgi:uroporphyrinogen-III synthase
MSDEETTASLVDHVLREDASGKKVAVQLHGFTDHAQLDRLTAAGARVLTVAPYRWLLPEDSTRVIRLVDAICAGSLDAVTFTSAPAVEALFSAADSVGRLERVVDALAENVVPAAVGHVTAAPLVSVGLAPIVPDRYRMGALIRLVCEHLTEHRVDRIQTALGPLELRGSALTLGGSTTNLAVTPLTMMRRFIAAGGAVVSRSELSAAVADAPDDHAVDVAISRLRHALPDPELITTVIKRGYRLNV